MRRRRLPELPPAGWLGLGRTQEEVGVPAESQHPDSQGLLPSPRLYHRCATGTIGNLNLSLVPPHQTWSPAQCATHALWPPLVTETRTTQCSAATPQELGGPLADRPGGGCFLYDVN